MYDSNGVFLFLTREIWTWEKIKHTHQYSVGGARLGMILKKQFAAIVWV